MKKLFNKLIALPAALAVCLALFNTPVFSQDEKPAEEKQVKAKPVKNTFQSVWIIDNQTVMVPIKGTLEMDIMHRFGTWNKGYEDFFGFFAPSNIRLGLSYAPINKLNVGFGITKEKMLWDVSAKYAIIQQTKGKYPVSVTFYTNAAYVGTKSKYSVAKVDNSGTEFLEEKHKTDRLLYFHQLIIARKLTDKLSVQIAPSLSHQNAVGGYYTKNDSTGKQVFKTMKHDHFALAVSARYKLTPVTSVILNYDQPLTKHPTSNPNPNLALGVEFNTSSHSFQLFFGNYFGLSPQRNNLFNTNSPISYTDAAGKDVKGGRFLIGFNITRLWNY
ncbi:MAG TPA: DUF5777 family beta-barrel protein [Chitinophagaceae bacterium]|nr:DUF5777 family beta-barrel protein [Chitinophagaceae bacterium]